MRRTTAATRSSLLACHPRAEPRMRTGLVPTLGRSRRLFPGLLVFLPPLKSCLSLLVRLCKSNALRSSWYTPASIRMTPSFCRSINLTCLAGPSPTCASIASPPAHPGDAHRASTAPHGTHPHGRNEASLGCTARLVGHPSSFFCSPRSDGRSAVVHGGTCTEAGEPFRA